MVEVLILQHPLEVHHAKGTARLLHMSLPRSRLRVGEVFDERLFEGGRHVLLYPGTPHAGMPVVQALAPAEVAERSALSGLCLVVLDGTWRKSLKMLHLNPALQKMPRLSLQDLSASQYRIRQAHKPHQRSTLEATCAALAQLEGDVDRFQPLLTAFEGFVAQQMVRERDGRQSARRQG